MQILIRSILSILVATAPGLAWAGVVEEFVVDAGEDVVLECEADGSTGYTLNGSVPDGPEVVFSWSTLPMIALTDDDSLTPTGRFPLGDTVVTLEAEDPGAMLSGDDSILVTVEDASAPIVQAMASPAVLWPPNHQMQQVRIRLRTRDRCGEDGDLQVELVPVTSDEPDNGQGDGNTVNDIQGANVGTDDREVLLRAERAGNGDGRVYTLVYRVTDGAGNATRADARVYVPHDYADVQDKLMDEMNGDRDDMENICPRPDVATEEFIDALPDLGDFGSRERCVKACSTWQRGCYGISGSTARCVYAEERAVERLEVNDCRALEDPRERRECLAEENGEAGDGLQTLRAEYRRAQATCSNVTRRCTNACSTLFDPNGSRFDDEGVGE